MAPNPLMTPTLTDTLFDGEEDPLLTSSKYYDCKSFEIMLNQLTDLDDKLSLYNSNSRSLIRHKSDFDLLFSEIFDATKFRFDLLSFTETWLNSNLEDLAKFDSYNSVFKHKPGTKEGGGIAIFIKDNLNYSVRDDLDFLDTDNTKFDCLFIEILNGPNSKTRNTIVGVIYRSPSHPTIRDLTQSLSKVLEKIQNENKDIILTGDLNIDLLQSGKHKHTTCFLDTLLSFHLFPKVTLPTRVTDSTATLIDHMFSNVSADKSLAGTLTTNITDHYSNFLFTETSPTKTSKPNYISYRKITDQALLNFNTSLESETWEKVYNCNNPNLSYQNFISIFTSHFNTNLPIKTVRFNRFKHKLEPWITKGLLKSSKTKQKLYISMVKARQTDNFTHHKNTYQRYLAVYRKLLKNAKQIYWSTRFDQARNNIKQTWNSIKDILNKTRNKQNLPSEFWYDGVKYDNEYEISNKFNEFYVNIGPNLASKLPQFSGNACDLLPSRDLPNSFSFEPTTHNEVINIINTLKPKTSSGYDQINPKLLVKTTRSIALPLTYISNLSLQTGIFPNDMKLAKVIPIFKSKDPHNFSNYRPISLLPTFSKILEKIVHKRLYKYLLLHDLLCLSQYGFQRHLNTEQAILEFQDRIVKYMSAKKWCSSIFLDLSKAFDCLDHNVLFSKLRNLGIRGIPLSWFKSYLSNRSQFVDFNGVKSNKKKITCGVPQGSILGPLLFLVYINDIVHTLDNCNSILFADDTTLLFADTDFDNLVTTMNQNIDKVYKWFCLNKLSLNIDKTNYVIFHDPRKKFPSKSCVKIDNREIANTTNTKFLGVYIDENMSWKTHCNIIANKCAKTLAILHRLKHYLPQHTLATIYHSLFVSHISYGISAFGNINSKELKRLKILQKKAIRVITNSKYNSHTGYLFKRTENLTLHDLFRQSCCKLYQKSKMGLLKPYFSNELTTNSMVHSYETRQANDIHQRNIQTPIQSQLINSKVFTSWNKLPDSLKTKNFHSVKSLSNSLKKHYLSQYSVTCPIPNCYNC